MHAQVGRYVLDVAYLQCAEDGDPASFKTNSEMILANWVSGGLPRLSVGVSERFVARFMSGMSLERACMCTCAFPVSPCLACQEAWVFVRAQWRFFYAYLV